MYGTATDSPSTVRATPAHSPQASSHSTLLNAAQCAMALGIPKTTIYRMVKNGLPAYRIGQSGRALRFDLGEVRQALRTVAHQTVRP